jgi:oligopeptidase B
VVFTAVPFVDVMNTMLDPTLPLTTQEYLGRATPTKSAAYDYMKSYCRTIRPKADHPIMLVRTRRSTTAR